MSYLRKGGEEGGGGVASSTNKAFDVYSVADGGW